MPKYNQITMTVISTISMLYLASCTIHTESEPTETTKEESALGPCNRTYYVVDFSPLGWCFDNSPWMGWTYIAGSQRLWENDCGQTKVTCSASHHFDYPDYPTEAECCAANGGCGPYCP